LVIVVAVVVVVGNDEKLLVLLLVVVMEENDVTTMMMTIGSGHSPCREMLPEAVGTYTLGPRAPACKALNVSDIPLATSS
jgi:hypothetical protein